MVVRCVRVGCRLIPIRIILLFVGLILYGRRILRWMLLRLARHVLLGRVIILWNNLVRCMWCLLFVILCRCLIRLSICRRIGSLRLMVLRRCVVSLVLFLLVISCLLVGCLLVSILRFGFVVRVVLRRVILAWMLIVFLVWRLILRRRLVIVMIVFLFRRCRVGLLRLRLHLLLVLRMLAKLL